MNFIDKQRAKVRKEKDVFIAPNATVLGDVHLGENVSIWFGAVLRADNDKIIIGARSNIQDNCVIHVDPGAPVTIGKEVIVGHLALIHGATVGDNSLIGMGSTILNHAKIGNWCIIGANALIPSGMEIPDYSIVMGSPGKVVKTLSKEMQEKVRQNAEVYVELAKKYMS